MRHIGRRAGYLQGSGAVESMSAVIQFEEANHPRTGKLRIALAGNPNCGKTTVFNAYTGARQHVGNYPGVTVDRKEGQVRHGQDEAVLVDLPGTYSLTAYSMEELVARAELSANNVQAVINVVDASALERNLLLTVQMLEMGLPLVLGCNMMDEARAAGLHIDVNRLSGLLGVPVVPMVAKSGEGLQTALGEAIRLAAAGPREPLYVNYGSDTDLALNSIEKKIARKGVLTERYSPRWTAIKLMEGDKEVRQQVREANSALFTEVEEECRQVADHIRDTLHVSMESYITDCRYGFIRGLLRDGIMRQEPGRDRLAISDSIDRVLTHAFFGPVLMLGVLYAMFWVTFTLGAYPQGWVEDGFAALGELMTRLIPEGPVRSLVVDGIIGGVGGVVSFVPLIAIMFALIAFLEDSGYMARVAYMMDRLFRMFGLHGASVMPYIISGGIAGGCAIPGAMATRTLRSPKEKLATLLTLPYMACLPAAGRGLLW